MLRLFAALPVPPPIATALTDLQSGVPGARWRPTETLHITLRFFDEVSETTAADLDAALSSSRTPVFDVALSGVGAFGPADRLRAVWAGVTESEALRILAARCEADARRCGLKREARAFRPHITLAYLKHSPQTHVAAWVQAHNLWRSQSWRATAFHLYSSWRTTEGSRYEIERTYPLVPGSDDAAGHTS